MKRLACLLLLVAAAVLAPASRAEAHALDPGYLDLQHLSGDSWRVFWRKPDVGGKPMGIEARLPENCDPAQAQGAPQFDGRAWVTHWLATCPGGLAGGRIVIKGLETTRTDVLVRVSEPDSRPLTARLTADRTEMLVPADMTMWEVAASYAALGVEHILGGFDHLLFVFALLVLIQSPGRLVGAITAFTVAHSITLALASLGVLSVPGPPVEAAIALSIVLLAVEILRQGGDASQLVERYPWVVSFSFGLLHGLGFAGALAEIGLPQDDIPLALLSFNLGVEAGQLMFVGAVLAIFGAIRMAWPRLAAELHTPGASGTVAMGYAIGGMSVYWLAERVAAF